MSSSAPSEPEAASHNPPLLDGPSFDGPPLEGKEGKRLRELFAFITAPSEAAERKKHPQSTLQFEVPKAAHQAIKRTIIGQELSLTEILVRYIVAHNYLSHKANPSPEAAENSAPVLEGPSFEGAPMKGTAGKRLWELFAFITAPSRPKERKKHEQSAVAFELPKQVHRSFRRTARVQGLSMTEVLVRYIVAHVHLSRAEDTPLM